MRGVGVAILVGALLGGVARPAAADEPRQAATTPGSRGQHRALWTVVGAGAGFAAGLVLGLRWFDDATYSERKIFTMAVILGAGGAVAGNLAARGQSAAATPGAPRIAGSVDWRQSSQFAHMATRLRAHVQPLE